MIPLPGYAGISAFLAEKLVRGKSGYHGGTFYLSFLQLRLDLGEDECHRNHFHNWGSYDFTVSPRALKEFEKEYGYGLTSEDFINQGRLHATHMAPGKKQLDYMKFTNRFVISFGKQLVDLVHSYGKKAYVFMMTAG